MIGVLRRACLIDGYLFTQAARFVVLVKANQRSRWRFAVTPLRHPRLGLMYLTFVLFVPRVKFIFSDEHDSAWVSEWQRQRTYASSHHVVLQLPESMDRYRQGRSRQAMRTNLTRARKEGLHCRAVDDAQKPALAATFRDELGRYADDDWTGQRWWVVQGSDDQPLALARIGIYEETARLVTLVARRDGSLTSEARYLAHTAIVEHLIEHDVKYLVVEWALGRPPGELYFAARLGYQPARISISRELSSSGTR